MNGSELLFVQWEGAIWWLAETFETLPKILEYILLFASWNQNQVESETICLSFFTNENLLRTVRVFSSVFNTPPVDVHFKAKCSLRICVWGELLISGR